MASVNKVIVLGNLCGDPESRVTEGGAAVANFSMATNERYKDKSGKQQERTEFHRVVVWGKLAELCGQYLAKGRQAYVEGRLQSRKWIDKSGNEKTTVEVIANNVVFLGGEKSASKKDQGDFDYGPPPMTKDDYIPY